jgi:hypothetical protein
MSILKVRKILYVLLKKLKTLAEKYSNRSVILYRKKQLKIRTCEKCGLTPFSKGLISDLKASPFAKFPPKGFSFLQAYHTS